jgi:hypothetical protein
VTNDLHEVEAALAQLVGLPLWATRRAADMQGFHFGAERSGVARFGPRKGEPVTHGEFALHVQCAWRITGPAGLYVGSRDLYQKGTSALDVSDDAWDWTVSGANRRDELLTAWLATKSYAVEAQTASRFGGFILSLADGYQLDVFPDVSDDSECWRMRFNDDDRGHLVVLGNGVER